MIKATKPILLDKKDLIINKSGVANKAVDPDLIGKWETNTTPPSVIRIDVDDWYYLTSKPTSYVISSDGSTLTFSDLDPHVVYTRKYGSAMELVGTWELSENVGNDTYIEEVTYRTDLTYTSHWTLNGQFESEWQGRYQDLGTMIETEERRAFLSTSAPDMIVFDVPYGPDFSGNYLKDNADQWTLTVGTNMIEYTRVP